VHTNIIRTMLAAAGLISAWILASTVAGSLNYVRPGPSFDFWGSAMPLLYGATEGPWQWRLLWELSGDAHHLLIPRILFLLEWYLGDFRNSWLLGFSWTALFLSAVILARAVWSDHHFDSTTRTISLILIVLGLGSAHHMNSLAYTFNQQWTSGLLLTLIWIQGVIRATYAPNIKSRWLHIGIALTAAALLAATTFSVPAILFSWVVMSLVLPMQRRTAISTTLILLLITLAYLNTLPVTSTLGKISVENPLLLAATALVVVPVSTLRFLGSPATEYSLAAGLLLATIALSLFAVTFFRARCQPQKHSFQLLAISLGSFVIMMALSTAIGRMDPAQAISPRFRTYVMPFLVCAAILAASKVQSFAPIWRTIFRCVIVAIAFLVVIPGHCRLLFKYSDEYDRYVPPFIALATGLTNEDAVYQALIRKFRAEDNRQMLGHRDFLERHDKGIFATPFYQQLGTRVDTFTANLSHESGKLIPLNDGAYRWTGTTEHCDRIGRVAVIDETGLVVGAGMVHRTLYDPSWRVLYQVFLPYCRNGHPARWTAYLPPHTASSKLFQAVVFDDLGKGEIIARNHTP